MKSGESSVSSLQIYEIKDMQKYFAQYECRDHQAPLEGDVGQTIYRKQ